MLGARLSGEIVFLDPERGCLVHLDAEAMRVWESCADISVLQASRRVQKLIADLAAAGVVRRDGARWARTPVQWIWP